MIILHKKPEILHFSQRSAFTLIEVLVVIGIIALLATISFVAMAPAMEGARIAATKTTINQLNRMIQEQVDGLMNSKELTAESDRIKKLYDASHSAPLSKQAANTLALYKLYRNAFPQKVDDMYGLDRAISTTDAFLDDSPIIKEMWDYGNNTWKVGSWGYNNANAKGTPEQQQRAESSELMYLFLSRGSSADRTTALNIDQINSRHIGDTDGDNNLEFFDDWGNPLQFYNWPTALFLNDSDSTRAAALTALFPSYNQQSTDGDPFDSTGEIERWNLNTAGVTLATGYVIPQLNNTNFKHPSVFWTFLIMSAGPDQELGLYLPAVVSPPQSTLGGVKTLDDVYDNITNRQQQ